MDIVQKECPELFVIVTFRWKNYTGSIGELKIACTDNYIDRKERNIQHEKTTEIAHKSEG